MSADERLVVMLEARVSEFEKRMQQAERRGTRSYQGLRRASRSATQQMENDMIRATNRINTALASTSSKIGALSRNFAGGFLGGMVGGAVGLFSAGALAGNIRSALADMSGIAKLADRIGMTTEALQGLQRGFDLSGVAADDFGRAMEVFGRNMGTALEQTGPMAPILDRYKIALRGANGEVKSQYQLLKEVADLMRSLPSEAQRLAVAQAAFGRGGAAMVNALSEGGASMDQMIDSAREAGVVIEDNLLRKAEDLDDRFAELSRTVGTWFKHIAVGAGDAAVSLTDFREELDRIFASEAEARAILGDEVYEAYAKNRDAVDENAESLGVLRGEYLRLGEEARTAGMAMQGAIPTLEAWGYSDLADTLRNASEEMVALDESIQNGAVTGEQLTERLAEIERQASDALDQLDATDRASFNGVISQLGRLGGVIAAVTNLAHGLNSALAGAVGHGAAQKQGEAMRQRHAAEKASLDSMNAMKEANAEFLATEQARNAATSEQLKLQREVEQVMKRAADAGATLTQKDAEALAAASLAADDARRGGGRSSSRGGGKSRRGGRAAESEFEREIEQTRQRITALEMEAASLIAAAASGEDYGDALEFARKRAELLNAAQRDGRALTPELRAEVDQLAQAYVTAGLSAEEAADRMRKIEEQSKRGQAALDEVFGAMLDGADSAREAVARLLMEIAKIQFAKAMMGMPGMDWLASSVGGLMGFGGYRAAGGPVAAGKAYMVGERGPEMIVPRSSGTVIPNHAIGKAEAQQVVVRLDLSADIEARILNQSQGIAVQTVRNATRNQADQQYLRGGR